MAASRRLLLALALLALGLLPGLETVALAHGHATGSSAALLADEAGGHGDAPAAAGEPCPLCRAHAGVDASAPGAGTETTPATRRAPAPRAARAALPGDPALTGLFARAPPLPAVA